MPSLYWDIFCRVIDNHGDIGVCWRLASQLAHRGHAVRLWVDDASALEWMAPTGVPGVEVRAWMGELQPHDAPPDVLVEAFGCDIRTDFIAACAERVRRGDRRPVWINLEYLSAENWVPRHHTLPSPVLQGPAAGWTKWFFYPGFTPDTGGLLREPGLLERLSRFDVAAWRGQHAGAPNERWISLFCYEPAALPALLAQCAQQPTQLLVTPGRAAAATRSAWLDNLDEISLERLTHKREQLSISYLPYCTQAAFDDMLWACDLNLVRGEDSLVRALWAGRPLVWQIYPQHDNAHHGKLHAFLDWLQAPPSLRQFHATWNALDDAPLVLPAESMLQEWALCVQSARARLLAQDDLVTQILGFIREKR